MDWKDKFLDKVVCGDCLELMKELPDGCVDLVVTDPPYNVGLDYGEQTNDNRPKQEYLDWYGRWLAEAWRAMRDQARLYVSCPDKSLFEIKAVTENIGCTFGQLLVWYGPNMPGGRAISLDWHPMHELIFLLRKGKRTPMVNAGEICNCHSVLIYTRPQRNFKNGRWHVAQKPLKLYKALIARSPGDIILDPFLGSGTTAVAAKQLGRHFIGIEIEPKNCKIAERRLSQEVLKL